MATVPTIGDDEVNGYVNRLYSAWGIGRKGRTGGSDLRDRPGEADAHRDRYGVEGVLPDGLVGQIRDRHMIPFLRQGITARGF